MSEPILIAGPASEPVTLNEAKAWMRVDWADDDARITSLIVTAREECEHMMGRKIIDQQWDVAYDGFPAGDTYAMKLPFDTCMPSAIVQIVYQNVDGQPVSWSSSNYALDPYNIPGYVTLLEGKSWPSDVADTANSVKVRVKCGFGPDAAAVPESIKTWILQRVAALYENRESVTVGAVAHADESADRKLDRWTILTV